MRYAEIIIISVLKCFVDTSLESNADGCITDEEKRFIRLIKQLLFILDKYNLSQLKIINEFLKYTKEVVNWVWSFHLHDSNRTNLNLKLLLFLQIMEDAVIRKGKENGQIM